MKNNSKLFPSFVTYSNADNFQANSIKVEVLDLETNVSTTYNSICAAAKAINCNSQSINVKQIKTMFFTRAINQQKVFRNIANFSTTTSLFSSNNPFYFDIDVQKSLIINENINKAGVYRWTNKINGNIYIGSSINLANRFREYLNTNYLMKGSGKNMSICKALLK